MNERSQKTILLVEDEAILSLMSKGTLIKLGYQVVTAEDGTAALEKIGNNPDIDLILMDIDLGPGIDGAEAASQILKLRELPVLFLSSHTEPEIVARTETITSYGYVVKGSEATVLDASIKMAFKLFAAKEEIRHGEARLRQMRNYYQAIIENAPEGIVVLSPGGKITFASRTARRSFGFEDVDPTAVRPADFTHPEDLPMVEAALGKIIEDPSYQPTLKYRFATREGAWRWVESTFTNLCGDPDVASIIINFRDISASKLYEEQLEYISSHDTSTGLFSRAYFNQYLGGLEVSRHLPISLISADVDGMKLIHDTFGYKFSEETLRQLAELFRRHLCPEDFLARIGGDEFAFVLLRTDTHQAEALVEAIQAELAQMNATDNIVALSVSFGVYTVEKPGLPLDRAFKQADDYMYRSKLTKGSSPKSNLIAALMAALSERDYITEGHSRRLTELGTKIGQALQLSTKQLENLTLLAQVHDIGKVGIPDNILLKPAPLTPEEWQLMRQHAMKGYSIATAAPELAGVAELILKHHERWDGQGYPLGLRGEEIPIECRIISVVDSFDAMTSDRPYSVARSKKEAVAEIEACTGTQFDPAVVTIFLKMLGAAKQK